MNIKSRLIFLNFAIMCKVVALISVVDVGVLPLVENSIGITLYVDITNEDRLGTCKVYSRCQKCCFINSRTEHCDVTIAFGEDIEEVNPRDRKTLLFVVPMLVQHDLDGSCEFLLNYDCNNTKGEVDVTVPFNTQVWVKGSKEIMNHYIGRKKISHCTTLDEDSLNYCEQVDCNIKYLDKRPIFDYTLNICVEVPICVTNPDEELPDYVYVPNSNTCRNLDLPLTVQDIYAISTGLGIVTLPPDSAVDMKIKVKSNCTTISQNLNLLRDIMYGKICPAEKGFTLDYSECLKSALFTTIMCIISVCVVLFICVCGINFFVWLYMKWSDGKLKEFWKDSKKLFKRRKGKTVERNNKIDSTIRDALLREVIVKDIPLGLRSSVVDVCDRMEKRVRKKKRYRSADVGSQISLEKSKDSFSSSTTTKSSSSNDKD